MIGQLQMLLVTVVDIKPLLLYNIETQDSLPNQGLLAFLLGCRPWAAAENVMLCLSPLAISPPKVFTTLKEAGRTFFFQGSFLIISNAGSLFRSF
ncbi:hypothetical protein [Acutalibacter intestini]|uniref:hypothetical protein n=1 Tax=Acutalibacter intestini TaxID=3093659 RepID=UPI002AC8E8AB|nr:hypothetical protein [Acutalibacter sp. M00204]